MIPSKSAYSSGWSSVCAAKCFSLGSRVGPFGTAQLTSTPSISSRKSQCIDAPRAAGPRTRAARRAAARAPRRLLAERLRRRVGVALLAVAFEIGHPSPILSPGQRSDMAARAISSGTISFGLVSIPIKVFTATSSKDVHFSMLHAKDKSRLKQQYVCATCGEIVPRTDTVKGYEYQRDQYVVVTRRGARGPLAARPIRPSRSRSSCRSPRSIRSTSRSRSCSAPTRAGRRRTSCCTRR